MKNKNFIIDQIKIRFSEHSLGEIIDKAQKGINSYQQPHSTFNHNTPFKINNNYLDLSLKNIDSEFLVFKEVSPHVDNTFYPDVDFLTIIVHINNDANFVFGDSFHNNEYPLSIGDVFRVRTNRFHWINAPRMNLLSNENFCVAYQYMIPKKSFNKISQEILAKIG